MSHLTPDYLLECFDFDRAHGTLTWRHRPERHFNTAEDHKLWTSRIAGQVAGARREDGYVRIVLDGKRYYAHRIIYAIDRNINLEDIPPEIDHIDFDKTNNRPENLREATRSQNVMNTSVRSDSLSGIKGVQFDRKRRKWVARIKSGDVRLRMAFETPSEASAWREATANDLHGDFARHATARGITA